MSERSIGHDGLRFRCRVDGPEGAPWVVFSNSLATDLTLWDAQAEALAGRFQVLRYDQRGHGGSSVPPGPATIEQLADDADALMAAVGAAGATFVGVSMGAATGLCLAARRSSRIARLVAADGSAATPSGGAAAWAGRLEVARTGGMAAFADITLPRWFTSASIAAGHPAVARIRRMIARTPLAGLEAGVAALQDYDLRPALGAIRMPVLLLAGSEDGAMPTSMPLMAAAIPGSRFVEIAGAGHLPPVEQPEMFTAALQDMLP